MKWHILALAGVLAVATSSLMAADKKKKDDKPSSDSMAEKIFLEADGNQDGYLSKAEFQKAHTKLQATINEMVQANTLGQIVGGIKDEDKAALAAVFTNPDTDKDGKISVPEFREYVKAVAADAELRMKNAQKGPQQGSQQQQPPRRTPGRPINMSR